jgi:hypothetical protein
MNRHLRIDHQEAAARAKRAEAQRKAVAEAQKIVAIWNARQAGGRELWFYPTIGAESGRGSRGLPGVLLGRTRAGRRILNQSAIS